LAFPIGFGSWLGKRMAMRDFALTSAMTGMKFLASDPPDVVLLAASFERVGTGLWSDSAGQPIAKMTRSTAGTATFVNTASHVP
jgi:hypothetical protein